MNNPGIGTGAASVEVIVSRRAMAKSPTVPAVDHSTRHSLKDVVFNVGPACQGSVRGADTRNGLVASTRSSLALGRPETRDEKKKG